MRAAPFTQLRAEGSAASALRLKRFAESIGPIGKAGKNSVVVSRSRNGSAPSWTPSLIEA